MHQHGMHNASALRKEGVSIGIDRVMQNLPKALINQPTCAELVRKLNLYKRKYNPVTGDYVGAEHNSASHYADAIRYLWTAIAQNWIDGKFIMEPSTDTAPLEYDTSELETTYYF